MSETPTKRLFGILLITLCLIVLTGIGIYSIVAGVNADNQISEELSENDKKHMISVYVGGEVIKPGEYALKEGSRVGDAIEAAGGFTEYANRKINVAVKLKNGGKVLVSAAGEDADAGIDFKININKAPAEEIMMIDGIGEKTAEKIIEYREENGGFSKPENIMNVEGIGAATYKKIKDIIVTE